MYQYIDGFYRNYLIDHSYITIDDTPIQAILSYTLTYNRQSQSSTILSSNIYIYRSSLLDIRVLIGRQKKVFNYIGCIIVAQYLQLFMIEHVIKRLLVEILSERERLSEKMCEKMGEKMRKGERKRNRIGKMRGKMKEDRKSAHHQLQFSYK